MIIPYRHHYKTLKHLNYTYHDILSKAVLLTNVLHGHDNFIAFELAHGFLPALIGLPQIHVNEGIQNANHEQLIRRALTKLLKSRVPQTVSSIILKKGQPIYFFEKKSKRGTWKYWIFP